MHIVIPMAGKSRRFFEEGFSKPKYLLPLGGQTMIEGVFHMFDPQVDTYVCIVNQEDSVVFGVKSFLDAVPYDIRVIEIARHDLGPTQTLLAAAEHIPLGAEIIVNYCDFLQKWNYQNFVEMMRKESWDGAVATFKGFHPASLGDTYYAYINAAEDGELLELREKQPFTENRIHEHASTGTYYFRNWNLFLNLARKQIEQNMTAGNGEYYPSLIYNIMRKDGLRSRIFEVDKFICLGTPKDYLEYVFWQEYFTKESATS